MAVRSVKLILAALALATASGRSASAEIDTKTEVAAAVWPRPAFEPTGRDGRVRLVAAKWPYRPPTRSSLPPPTIIRSPLASSLAEGACMGSTSHWVMTPAIIA